MSANSTIVLPHLAAMPKCTNIFKMVAFRPPRLLTLEKHYWKISFSKIYTTGKHLPVRFVLLGEILRQDLHYRGVFWSFYRGPKSNHPYLNNLLVFLSHGSQMRGSISAYLLWPVNGNMIWHVFMHRWEHWHASWHKYW
jgi:hypothetical protein